MASKTLSVIEEVWEKPSDYEDVVCHVNSTFKNDESELDFICGEPVTLLTRFGERGRDLAQFQDATDINYIDCDKILVTDMINNRVVCYNETGNPVQVYEGEGIKEPWASTVDEFDRICVTSRKNKHVIIMSHNSETVTEFGSDYFQRPCGIAVTKSGNFVVTDMLAGEVTIYSKDGGDIILTLNDPTMRIEKRSFTYPRYVHVTLNGDIVVSDSGQHCLKIFDKNGAFVKSIGRYGKGDGFMKSPHGVTSDSHGNIIVADHYNDRVSLFSRGGEFICHLVTAEDGIIHPQGVDLSRDLKLFVTHGNLKAHTISVFQINLFDDREVPV
ncbi:hypothetical protein KUTeg_000023 [Tegillarca granosa]|uniref:Uncharacterized protein n=1 Tax=Tegillarca granosa TaxID=220873 RepID=A0ABQ9FYW6_TEGGR|nr:hypothetical protein KUTeg_000023 [Tegillarca granosa]